MEKPDDLYGEWVLHGIQQHEGHTYPVDEPLLLAAREAWPHVLAHARRKLGEKGLSSDSTVLAADIWENVLRAILKKRQRNPDHQPPIVNLERYLIGIFHHRFERFLGREQKRLSTIDLVASAVDLEKIASAQDTRWAAELERAITIKQIVSHMDQWTGRAWKMRQIGYSWKVIAKRFGLTEQQAIMRYRYGLEKTRERLLELLRKHTTNSPIE